MPEICPTWLEVERAIQREIVWLKDNIVPYQPNKNPLNYSDNIFYRSIAILIVSGSIKVTEYSYSHNYQQIIKKYSTNKKHGADWHNNIINYLAELFELSNYKVEKQEPKLYYGYADLKIVNNTETYFEIDTINIFKLYVNLKLMEKINIIIITTKKIIKFEL